MKILTIGPNLPVVHGANAFGKEFDGLDAAENAPCTASKGVDDQIALAIWNQHDRQSLIAQKLQMLQYAIARQRSIIQVSIDKDDIRLFSFELEDGFGAGIG